MRKLIVVLLSCLLAVSGLALAPQVAEAAPAVALKVSPTKPVRGATFAVTGKLPTKVKRPVELQAKVGGKWKKVASGKTDAKGTFSLKASTKNSSLTVRVVAAKAKVGKKTYAKVTSKTKKITTVTQSISAAKITPAKPIKGETFTVTGSVKPKVKRAVELQAKVGGKWKKVASGKTDAKGKFSFKTSTKASSLQLRVVAKKATVAKVGYPQLTGKTVTVKAIGQTAKLSIASSAFVNQGVTATLTFTPTRSGRATQVQVLDKGKWVTLAKGTQDAKGVSAISLVGTDPGTYQYRAYAPAAKGAPAVSSKAVKVKIEPDNVEISDDARPLTDDEAASVSKVDVKSGDVVLKSAPSSAKSIAKGDVVAVPPTDGAPSGALVVVEKVTTSGSTTTLKTKSANLPDVVENVPDDASEIGLSVLSSSFEPAEGVEVLDLPAPAMRARGFGLSEALSSEIKLKVSSERTFGLVKVGLEGEITGSPFAEMSFDMDWGKVKSYKLGAGIKAKSNLSASVGVSGTASTKLASIPLGMHETFFVGAIGSVPVWVEVKSELVAEISATGTIEVVSEVSHTGTFVAGITNQSSTSLKPKLYASHGVVAASGPDFKQTGTLKNFNGYKGGLYLYSLKGPSVKVGGEYTLKAERSVKDGLTCTLKGEAIAEAALETTSLFEKLTGKSDKMSLTRSSKLQIELSSCDGVLSGGPKIATTTLPDGTVGEDYTATLAASGGTAPYAWTATGLPAGLTLSTAGKLTGKPSLAGDFSPKITVTDKTGKTASAQIAVKVDGGGADARVIQIAAANYHTCALLSGGTVKCWGYNQYGQLGDGTTEDRSTPVSVSGLSGATAITAGYSHTCALLSGGTLKCWGANWYGQLGDGTTEDRSTPVSVSGLSGATAITAGGSHMCAKVSGGTLKCWGANWYGQLGDGTTEHRSTPVSVSGLSGATAITAGYYHSCALLSGGTVKCWGYNGDGQLGDGTPDGQLTPVSVSGLSGAAAITASYHHTCALLSGGTLECWGANWRGQLGDGTTEHRSTPVSVSGLSGATVITTGGDHTCALLSGGTVKCWGGNEHGRLGDGSNEDRWTPVQVVGLG